MGSGHLKRRHRGYISHPEEPRSGSGLYYHGTELVPAPSRSQSVRPRHCLMIYYGAGSGWLWLSPSISRVTFGQITVSL